MPINAAKTLRIVQTAWNWLPCIGSGAAESFGMSVDGANGYRYVRKGTGQREVKLYSWFPEDKQIYGKGVCRKRELTVLLASCTCPGAPGCSHPSWLSILENPVSTPSHPHMPWIIDSRRLLQSIQLSHSLRHTSTFLLSVNLPKIPLPQKRYRSPSCFIFRLSRFINECSGVNWLFLTH